MIPERAPTFLRIEQIAVLEFFACARDGNLAEKEAAYELAKLRADKLMLAKPGAFDPDEEEKYRKIQSEFPAPLSDDSPELRRYVHENLPF